MSNPLFKEALAFSLRRPLAVAIAALSVLACSDKPKDVAVETVNAPIEVISTATMPDVRVLTGTVRPSTVSPLSAKVLGDVRRVLVSEGDHVRAGQLLVEIEDRAAMAQSAGATAGEHAVDEAVAGANAAVSAAEANATLAAATYKRYAALRERGSVSPQEFDEISARNQAAQAELERARRGRDQAIAQRGAAKAGVTAAQTFLGYAQVRSPIDGVVAARFVDPGAQAAPGMPLLTVEDDAHSRVETTVDESITTHAGDAVSIEANGQQIPARVSQVAALDPSTRSALVKIALPATSPRLRGGTFVRVAFTTGTRKALSIPLAAIMRNGQLTSVFVVGTDGIARTRLITLGEPAGDRVEVLSGLDDGERIIPTITKQVRDGVKVDAQAQATGRMTVPATSTAPQLQPATATPAEGKQS